MGIFTIKVEPMIGSSLMELCVEGARLANLTGCTIRWEMNGVDTNATPECDPEKLMEAWRFAHKTQGKHKIALV